MSSNNKNNKNLPGEENIEDNGNNLENTDAGTNGKGNADKVDAFLLDTFSDDDTQEDSCAPADTDPGKKKKKESKLKSRAFKRGGLAILITCLFVAAVVVVNLIVGILSDKFPSINLDMTGTKMNELSQNTLDFLSTVDQDVEILVLAPEKEYVAANQYFLQANSLLKQYAAHSDKIKISYMDMSANPTFTSKYPKENLAAGDYIIKCGEKYRVLTTTDLFNMTTDQSTGQSSVESLNVEPSVTTAILNVTSKNQTKITFIKGFGDYNADAFKNLLKSNNYDVTETSLVTDKIDSETPVAVLFAPTVDLDASSLQKLTDYLSNDGEYGRTLLYVASSQSMETTPLLDSFLEEWGIKVEPGLIAETDADHLPTANQYALSVFDYNNEDFTSGLKNSSIPVASMYTKPITILDEKTTRSLFKTSEKSAMIPYDADENFDIEKAVDGSRNGAVISTHTGKNANSSVITLGSDAMLASSFLSTTSFNNSAYFLNMVNIQADHEEEGISIEPKNLTAQSLGILSPQANAVGTVFMIVVPILILVLGIVLWVRRRNK